MRESGWSGDRLVFLFERVFFMPCPFRHAALAVERSPVVYNQMITLDVSHQAGSRQEFEPSGDDHFTVEFAREGKILGSDGGYYASSRTYDEFAGVFEMVPSR